MSTSTSRAFRILRKPEKLATSYIRSFKPLRLLFYILIGCTCLACYSSYTHMFADKSSRDKTPNGLRDEGLRIEGGNPISQMKETRLRKSEGMACQLPVLDPFDESVMPFVKTPEPINCQQDHPMIFDTDLESNLIQLADPKTFGYNFCCYQEFTRAYGYNDRKIKLGETCVPITATKVPIPETIHSILVYCQTGQTNSDKARVESQRLDTKTMVPIDAFGFIHLKPSVEDRIKKLGSDGHAEHSEQLASDAMEATGKNIAKNIGRRKVNVLVLGLDTLSHMNFIRIMPLTHEYLTKNLSAHCLSGYTKVADNTYIPQFGYNLMFDSKTVLYTTATISFVLFLTFCGANFHASTKCVRLWYICVVFLTVALLTGQTVEEIKRSCWKGKKETYDKCPFVWKNFSSSGFRTFYAEDGVNYGIFNYEKPGFSEDPTDYYYNALLHQLKVKVGHNRVLCYGPRLCFAVLLENLKKVAFGMNKSRRYFQFNWASELFHEDPNRGSLGDELLLRTLQWFQNGGYFEDTVFILVSDHGLRWGDILTTPQGRLEERMPFLYFVLPAWFKERYNSAVSNLMQNELRLTTPFDLYETFHDLISLERLEAIRDGHGSLENELPRGISLFHHIPPRRTCRDAGIDDHWCVCGSARTVSQTSSLVLEGARNAVHYINGMFVSHPQCLPLSLSRVLSTQVVEPIYRNQENNADTVTDSDDDDPRLSTQNVTFAIVFKVDPSHASFDATTTRRMDGSWHISGEISRTSRYNDQSKCVSDYVAKKYCFCRRQRVCLLYFPLLCNTIFP